MITAIEAMAHRGSILRNTSKWSGIDFEFLSNELCVEINHEMSPIVVRRVIEGRLTEMSVREYDKVPQEVWDYLQSIEALGKFEAVHKTNHRTQMFPLKVRKLTKDVISLSPIGTSVASLYDALLNNEPWNELAAVTEAEMMFENDQISIRSKFLYPWSEKQITEIFQSLDEAGKMELRSYL